MAKYIKQPITIEILGYDPDAKDNKFYTKGRYTFIGDVPSNVQKQLSHIDPSKKDKVLEKWLPNYETILHIKDDYIHKPHCKVGGSTQGGSTQGYSSKRGGDLFNEAEMEDILEEEVDIMDIVDEDYEEKEDIKIVARMEKATRKGKPFHKFIFDMDIYPEDSLLDLKHKLYLTTGIHTYKQHMFYPKNNDYIPMGYKIKSAISLNTSILQEYNCSGNEVYTGIVINSKLYDVRDTIHVDPYDGWTIMAGYMDPTIPPVGASNILHDNSTQTKFYMIQVDEFLDTNRAHFNSLGKVQKDTIYYSLVIKYFPMMTMDVYYTYLIDESKVKESYPDLVPHRTSLTNRYSKQQKFLNSCNDFHMNDKGFISDFTLALTYTQINISPLIHRNVIINLREIFDNVKMISDIVIGTMYISTPDDLLVSKVVDKIGDPGRFNIAHVTKKSLQYIILKQPPPSGQGHKYDVLFDKYNYIKLCIEENGTCNIYSHWKISKNYTYEDIYNICRKLSSPLLEQVNKIIGRYKYPLMTPETTRFMKLDVSILWKQSVKEQFYKSLNDLMINEMIPMGLVGVGEKNTQRDELARSNLITYHYYKGIYVNDISTIKKLIYSNNYYAYLTSQNIYAIWEHIYIKNKQIVVSHRYSDIKVDIGNIDEQELFFIFRHMSYLLYKTYQSNTELVIQTKSTKAIRGLQEQDPELYKYKGADPKKTYSIVCQKPHQPQLISTGDIKKVADYKQKIENGKILKYKNISTGEDVYYSCPNAKYPYIKFLVGYHPQGHCIPCCQKLSPESINEYRKYQHETCLNTTKYTKDDIQKYEDEINKSEVVSASITSLNRHIITYGKNINIGRFCRLPEMTLEMLFYDSYSQNYTGIEEECINFDDISYLIYGCQQNTRQMYDIGMFYSLAHIMDKSISETVDLLEKKLMLGANLEKFHLLLNGDLEFKTPADLVKDIKNVFINGGFSNFDRWNDLIMDICWIYLKIRPILFKDSGNSVSMVLPDGLSHPKEYINILEDTQKYIILIQNDEYINPIYIVDTSKIITTVDNDPAINTRMYNSNDVIMEILYGVVSDSILYEQRLLNIFNIIEHLPKVKGYEIINIFINTDNLCYGCLIRVEKGKIPFYFPLKISNYNIALIRAVYPDVKTIQGVIDNRYLKSGDMKQMLEFISKFNKYIEVESKRQDLYKMSIDGKNGDLMTFLDLIIVDKILVYGGKCIGIQCNNMNYYTSEMSIKDAKKLTNVDVIYELMYHPTDVNLSLYKDLAGTKDDYNTGINRALYDKYIYQLALMELFMYMSREVNTSVRNKLKSLVSKITTHKNYTDGLDNIKELLVVDVTSKDFKTIRNLVNTYNLGSGKYKGKSRWDATKLIIDETKFRFDAMSLHRIQDNFEIDDYKKRVSANLKILEKISPKVYSVGEVKANIKMPNILSTCPGEDYCRGDKLIIPKKTLNNILPQIAMTLGNIHMTNVIYYIPFINNIMNLLKFAKNDDEEIYVKYT